MDSSSYSLKAFRREGPKESSWGWHVFALRRDKEAGRQEFDVSVYKAFREEQIIAAERVEEVQGMGAWPKCGQGH